ncbi:MAG TPA: mechanosensitive ion channel domain-containing protein [Myxococcales bacterium]
MNLVQTLERLQPWFAWAPPWVFTLALMALALAGALVAHALLLRVMRRTLRGGEFWRSLLVRTSAPGRLALVVAALSAALAASPLTSRETALAQHAFGIAFIVLLGWAVVIGIDVGSELYLRRIGADLADNLLARKHATQVRILQRAAHVVIVFLTAAMALMTIGQVRQWGVSLLAAGGAATLIVGLALQPLLSNLIAGIQIAMTQPIRIDDQVQVENEVGAIEEITATYVVVRLWDERRMLLPLTYFLQKPFQNWTRETANRIGAVVLHVDYATRIDPLRTRLTELLKASPLWDGRVNAVQVSDAKERSMQVTCLMSAADSGKLSDLCSAVREALIVYLRDNFPEALPRDRLEIAELTAARRAPGLPERATQPQDRRTSA